MMGMKQNENWYVLNYINSKRNDGDEITFGNAKGLYIARERRDMENVFGKKAVTEVFGEPSDLEEAEILLLEIEKGEIDLAQEYDNLIKIAHKLSRICLVFVEYDVPTPCQEYVLLTKQIPIPCVQSGLFSDFFLQTEKKDVSIEELKRNQVYLESKRRKASTDLLSLEFMAKLVVISLKEIFKEVKKELNQ